MGLVLLGGGPDLGCVDEMGSSCLRLIRWYCAAGLVWMVGSPGRVWAPCQRSSRNLRSFEMIEGWLALLAGWVRWMEIGVWRFGRMEVWLVWSLDWSVRWEVVEMAFWNSWDLGWRFSRRLGGLGYGGG